MFYILLLSQDVSHTFLGFMTQRKPNKPKLASPQKDGRPLLSIYFLLGSAGAAKCIRHKEPMPPRSLDLLMRIAEEDKLL